MSIRRTDLTIVFADLVGSTALYHRLGDEAAKSLVIGMQASLCMQVEQLGGSVHEVVGDEILAVFEAAGSAAACAGELHRVAADRAADSGEVCALRIGMHRGDVIVEDGRMFGETINLASRMVGMAIGGQTLLTDAVFQALPLRQRDEARRFERLHVRGLVEPIAVYDLPGQRDDLTALNTRPDETGSPPRPTLALVLERNRQRVRLPPGADDAMLGRAPGSTLVVDADPVSRRHARIECRQNVFILIDTSTNGTLVRLGERDDTWLRRERMPLLGSGLLALGGEPMVNGVNTVHFRLEREDPNV